MDIREFFQPNSGCFFLVWCFAIDFLQTPSVSVGVGLLFVWSAGWTFARVGQLMVRWVNSVDCSFL